MNISNLEELLTHGQRWIYFYNALRPHFGVHMKRHTPLAVLQSLGYAGDGAIATFPRVLLGKLGTDLLMACDPVDGIDLSAHSQIPKLSAHYHLLIVSAHLRQSFDDSEPIPQLKQAKFYDSTWQTLDLAIYLAKVEHQPPPKGVFAPPYGKRNRTSPSGDRNSTPWVVATSSRLFQGASLSHIARSLWNSRAGGAIYDGLGGADKG